MPAFTTTKLIRFHHCDPFGIVFYPQYFMIFNEVVEDWFAAALGIDFRKLHMDDRRGVPVRKTECEFFAPSRLGDVLDCALTVTKVGHTSCALTIVVSSGGEKRAEVKHVLVHLSADDGKGVPWSDDTRARMSTFLAAPRAATPDGT